MIFLAMYKVSTLKNHYGSKHSAFQLIHFWRYFLLMVGNTHPNIAYMKAIVLFGVLFFFSLHAVFSKVRATQEFIFLLRAFFCHLTPYYVTIKKI